ncbi:Plasmid stabilization system protein [Candidatus Accumulibacter aalborgensis]|uniref:Plasmid stabilization system protein n=1 Tax=Candidatus Accumulibacter aalborgensis TaxID=1860102 RepID=A0A1A8XWK3_9PROT|nr:type II toxin-antitoxin system RelE/ParE family toxin [Candidatus Accumulibacter aalborgensis]SBT08388.1 Plasmid stabilization system protein [Candidatus Accumulibacter aalborgensis]
MKVTLHPGAEQDIREAAAFYEREGSAVLAARFVAEFKRLSSLLVEHPEIGSPRTRDRRGFAMSIFPYTVIYRAGADEIRVLVVKHDSKRPGYGRTRV